MFVLGYRRSGHFDLVFLECDDKCKRRTGASLAESAVTGLSDSRLSGYAISNRTAYTSTFVRRTHRKSLLESKTA